MSKSGSDFNKDKSESDKSKHDANDVNKQNRDTLGDAYNGPDVEEDGHEEEDKDPNTTAAGTPKDKKVDRSKY